MTVGRPKRASKANRIESKVHRVNWAFVPTTEKRFGPSLAHSLRASLAYQTGA